MFHPKVFTNASRRKRKKECYKSAGKVFLIRSGKRKYLSGVLLNNSSVEYIISLIFIKIQFP